MIPEDSLGDLRVACQVLGTIDAITATIDDVIDDVDAVVLAGGDVGGMRQRHHVGGREATRIWMEDEAAFRQGIGNGEEKSLIISIFSSVSLIFF